MKKGRLLLQIAHSNLDYLRHKKENVIYESRGIFDVNNFPEQIFSPRVEWVPQNQYYGAERVLRKFAGIQRPLDAFMEHGIQEKGDLEVNDIKEYNRKNFITFSVFRKEQYEKLIGDNRKICVVGPYIKYAPLFYSAEEQQAIKDKYGKILTFFPMHTTYGYDATKYDPEFEYVIEQIEKYREQLKVDTVFVCGYWRDYYVGRLEKYNINDYVMVSAGHGMSQKFLSRLRSIIELSDYTMSDAFGTQVGYSIGLGVPHIVLEKNGASANHAANGALDWVLPYVSSYDQFGSKEQIDMMDYVFGTNQTKSATELRKLLR